MTVHIEDLKFQCIIGILDFEREKPQDVIINTTIEYLYEHNNFINYADVAQHIKKQMETQQFYLVEDALQHLSQTLHQNFAKILTLSLKITKPSILSDCKVSVSEIFYFDS